MKHLKKTFTLILTFLILISCVVSAYAEDYCYYNGKPVPKELYYGKD